MPAVFLTSTPVGKFTTRAHPPNLSITPKEPADAPTRSGPRGGKGMK
jgi:hypothetical protein